MQFIFYKQFQEVVDHARKKNLKLIIDVPYFLNLDNAEVWANKNEFMVTSEGTIAEFAGTPSDIYYPLGQKWDIPVYNMETMQKNDYKIIRDRFRWYARFMMVFAFFISSLSMCSGASRLEKKQD